MNEKDIVLSCDPASPRRLQVPGPASVKSVTEDCAGASDQASVSGNATGSNTKKYVQQAFHPSLFTQRPRSFSLGNPVCNKENTSSLSEAIATDNDVKPGHPVWQRSPTQRNSKRKRQTNSPSNTKRHISCTQDTSTSNRFSGLPIDLTDEDSREQSEIASSRKVHKPPPIILYGIEDLSNLTDLLNKAVPSGTYSYKIVNRDQLRIVTLSTEIYKDLMEHIRKNGLIGHTFTQKEKKCYRIVVKNLHHTTPKIAIIEEIEKTGNKVRGEIVCAISKKNKKPLNMFFVNIEPSPNNPDIKNIKFIYHTRVKIEDPRKSNDIPQCIRCQQYGHTKNNCMRPYRCVKCAEGHKTTDCPKKDRNTPATCTLCFGDHPANYKGCQVYKEIRARKINRTINKKQSVTQRSNKSPIPPAVEEFPPLHTQMHNYNEVKDYDNISNFKRKMTYSTATRRHVKKIEDVQPQSTSSLEQIIIKQSEKIDILIQQMGTLLGLLTTLIARQQK